MKFRYTDGEGYFKNDNRLSGGLCEEGGIIGCAHCHAAIKRPDIEKPKIGLALRARCWSCDGYLCPECGLATHLHGHNHPESWRTWPHQLWIRRAIDEVHKRKTLGV